LFPTHNIGHYLDEAFADREIMGGKKTLVHGDMSEANIIVNNNSLSGIIDFEHAKIMTPALDFATMYLSFHNSEIVDEIAKKYHDTVDTALNRRTAFMTLLCELMIGCNSAHIRYRMLYRLEKKYGDRKKARLYRMLASKYSVICHFKILKYQGLRKYILHSYNYRKQQVFDWIGKQ
jgi:aminoglycoside phosphotransferase